MTILCDSIRVYIHLLWIVKKFLKNYRPTNSYEKKKWQCQILSIYKSQKTEIVTVKFEILALNFSCATYTLILNNLKMQTNSFTIICQLNTVTNACIQLLNV